MFWVFFILVSQLACFRGERFSLLGDSAITSFYRKKLHIQNKNTKRIDYPEEVFPGDGYI